MPYNAMVQNSDEWRAKNRMSALPPFWRRQSQSEVDVSRRNRPVSEFMFYPVNIVSVEDFETVSPLIPYEQAPWKQDSDFDLTHNPLPSQKKAKYETAHQSTTKESPPNLSSPVDPRAKRSFARAPILAKDWSPTTTCEPRAVAYDDLALNERRNESEHKKSWRKKATKSFKKFLKLASSNATRTHESSTNKPAPQALRLPPPSVNRMPDQAAGDAFVELHDDDEDRPDSGVGFHRDKMMALPTIATRSSGHVKTGLSSQRNRHSVVW